MNVTAFAHFLELVFACSVGLIIADIFLEKKNVKNRLIGANALALLFIGLVLMTR